MRAQHYVWITLAVALLIGCSEQSATPSSALSATLPTLRPVAGQALMVRIYDVPGIPERDQPLVLNGVWLHVERIDPQRNGGCDTVIHIWEAARMPDGGPTSEDVERLSKCFALGSEMQAPDRDSVRFGPFRPLILPPSLVEAKPIEPVSIGYGDWWARPSGERELTLWREGER